MLAEIRSRTTRGLRTAYHKSRFFIRVPRGLPCSGVKKRFVTGLKDFLETVCVSGADSTIEHSKYALVSPRVEACATGKHLVPGKA